MLTNHFIHSNIIAYNDRGYRVPDVHLRYYNNLSITSPYSHTSCDGVIIYQAVNEQIFVEPKTMTCITVEKNKQINRGKPVGRATSKIETRPRL